ncbi:MAG TPA: fluoride efflux transporter CrcB [Bacillales bacterium]|nr:fluoride efflux transporter CrcB [Bacillales bacterium]
MNYFLVGVAGMIGALLRYEISLIFYGEGTGAFPFGTFVANMAGSFVLGWFTTYIMAMRRLHPHVLTAIGTGLIGSFTTFSTFSVETVQLLRDGFWVMGIFYVLISLFGGLFMSALGYYTGKQLYRRRREKQA